MQKIFYIVFSNREDYENHAHWNHNEFFDSEDEAHSFLISKGYTFNENKNGNWYSNDPLEQDAKIEFMTRKAAK